MREYYARLDLGSALRCGPANAAAINAAQVVLNPDAVGALRALSARTDDPAIQFEIARIFVNAARSLCRSRLPPVPAGQNITETLVRPPVRIGADAVARLAEKDILGLLVGMLVKSGPYPVLANEALIALAVLTAFGPASSGE